MNPLDPLAHLIEFFIHLWRADRRPEAHHFILGCIGVLIAIAALGALLLWFLYPDHPWT